MKILYKWCENCGKATEHETFTIPGTDIRCRACVKCGRPSDIPADRKLRNVFGPKGRGF